MGMLQKYRNKLRQDVVRERRKKVDKGEVKTVKLKVRVPGLPVKKK